MTGSAIPRYWSRPRIIAVAVSALALMVFIGANAHLIAVAFATQPDCVAHSKSPTEGAVSHIAAKSSC
ncbi:MAG: hypothetical protein WD969_02860 [Paracoccaceae bacterium]